MAIKSFDESLDEDNSLILTKISGINFYSYPDFSIDFSDLTIISGDNNGSGKTSIAQAISFGLTGKLIPTFEKDIKVENIIHDEEKILKINIEGFIGKIPISISRYKNVNGEKSITIIYHYPSGDVEVKGNDAEEEINDLITSEEFNRLIYINGHDINTLIKGSPLTRSKLLDKIFGITMIDDVISKIKPNMYLDELSILHANINKKNAQINTIERNIKSASLKQELESEFANKQSIIVNLEKELQDIKDVIDPMEVLEKKWKDIKSKSINYQNSIKKLEDSIFNNKSKIQKKQLRIKQMRKILKNHIKDKKSSDIIKELEDFIEQRTKDISKISFWFNLKQDISNIQTTIIDKNINGNCPVCNSQVDPFNVGVLMEKNNNPQLQLFQKDIKDAYKKINMINKLTDSIKLIKKEIQTINFNVAKQNNMIDTLFQKNLDFETPAFDNRKLQEFKIKHIKKEAEINSFNREINSIEIKLSRISISKDAINTVKRLHNEITLLEDEDKILNKKRQLSKDMRDGFLEMLKKIRKEMVNKVNPKISHWIKIFQPYAKKDSPPLDYRLYIKDVKDGVRYFHDVYRYQNPTEFNTLSTGQQATCAISLILAISDLSYHHLGMIIFDELHTSGIDMKVTERILKNIIKLIKNTRIIFIDRRHDLIQKIITMANESKFESNHYVTKFNKTKKKSHIKLLS